MGQVLQKIKRAPNRIRAVVAGPPLVIGDEEPFVLSKPQSDESANLNDAVLAFPVGPKELFGLKFSKKHMTWAIKQPYADEALKKELDGINSMELMEHVNDTNVDWDSL
jgi:hypothetical protein